MPIHDYFIDNGTGANVRADINAALSAIVSLNSNPTEPGTMYAYQLWADTTSNLLKIRNSGNSAWITLRQLDGDFSIVAVEDGAQATPSLTFTNDLNTGIFRPGNDSLAIVTGATRAITITSTQAVGIQTPNPNAALHVAGSARVGADSAADAILEIGEGATGNRNSYIDIVADTTYTDYGLRVIRNNTGANATSELKHRGTGALNFTTQEAAPIVFNTTNSPALTILAGGNVGIGTSLPSTALHVNGDGTFGSTSPTIIKANGDINFAGNYNGVLSKNSTYVYLGSTNNSVALWPNSGTNANPGLIVDNSNRVGIGTAGPSAPLNIASTGNGHRVLIDDTTNDNTLGVFSNATDIRHVVLNNARGAYKAYAIQSNGITFNATNGSASATIDTSGRLLVGTTSAGAGTVNAASIVGSILNQSTGLRTLSSGGTLDLDLLGTGIVGHLYVTSVLTANAAIRTSTIFFIATRQGNNTVITSLNSADGSTNSRSFTITNPSANTFRFTDTSSSDCTVSMSFVGGIGS